MIESHFVIWFDMTQHHNNIQALRRLVISSFYDFCGFCYVVVSIMYMLKLQFLKNIYVNNDARICSTLFNFFTMEMLIHSDFWEC